MSLPFTKGKAMVTNAMRVKNGAGNYTVYVYRNDAIIPRDDSDCYQITGKSGNWRIAQNGRHITTRDTLDSAEWFIRAHARARA